MLLNNKEFVKSFIINNIINLQNVENNLFLDIIEPFSNLYIFI